MSPMPATETLTNIDAVYELTIKPKLDAIDDPRRQVRWMIVKSLLIVLPPIALLIGGG